MKNTLIAYCGLNCEKCDARIATINNDDELRAKTAKAWCEMNHTDQITPETINCMGCRADGIKFAYCSYMCPIRKCASAKGFETCADCPEKTDCPNLAPMRSNEEVKCNLEFSPRPRFTFNTIGFLTSDNKTIVDFYTKAFGFTTTWDGIQPNVEMFLGDMRLILYPRDLFEQMTSQKYSYAKDLNGASEIALDVPTFADVDKEYQNALSYGAKSVLPPTTEPWGQRTCYIADPDGNLIEIGSFTEL